MSWRRAATTVTRATASSAARIRDDGRRVPGARTPSSIARRSSSPTCSVSGTAAPRSMRRNSVAIALDSRVGGVLGLAAAAASLLIVFIMENDGRSEFDFWFGDWAIHNRRLRRRLQNDTEWQEFEATGRTWP